MIKYPRRAKRIYNAVIKFSLVFLKSFLIEPLTYRPNVACLLYRKFNDQYQILLVKRSEDADHWQLPQGGTDGEKLATAATREIHEELNTTNIIIRKIYKNVYRYHNQNLNSKHTYRGQRQGLAIVEYLGDGSDIKINYWDHSAWRFENLTTVFETVHTKRKPGVKIFLQKFTDYLNNK